MVRPDAGLDRELMGDGNLGQGTASTPWLAAVKARLAQSSYPTLRRLQCDFQVNAVILRGEVSNWFEKQFAQELVAGVPGVQQVVNQTRVSGA